MIRSSTGRIVFLKFLSCDVFGLRYSEEEVMRGRQTGKAAKEKPGHRLLSYPENQVKFQIERKEII
jgi:hypothetical protein